MNRKTKKIVGYTLTLFPFLLLVICAFLQGGWAALLGICTIVFIVVVLSIFMLLGQQLIEEAAYSDEEE